MPEMDQGIKRLLQTHPADVLSLALPDAEYLGTLPVDVATEPQLTLDSLLHVRYHGVECAVDLEAEAHPKPDIGRRLFEYGARASIVADLPVISVVLWLEANGAPVRSPYELHAADRLLATWHYSGIEVYQLQAPTLLASGVLGLLPLVPFTQGSAPATIERTAELVKEQAPSSEVGELESLLLVFAARKYDATFAMNIARRLFMSTEIVEKSALYQLWTQQGREQGKQEGLREATTLTLRARFGELPQDIAEALAHASSATLEALLLNITTDTLEQARQRLGL